MITAESLKGCKLGNGGHMRGSGWFGYFYQCIEHPRLMIFDKSDKKTRKTTRLWLVDNVEVENLAAAAEALNAEPRKRDGKPTDAEALAQLISCSKEEFERK